MTRVLIFSAFSMLLAGLALRADDKDAPEKLVQETIKNIKDMTKVLKDVQNKDQAEKAKKDLDPIFARIADVRKRYTSAPAPTKEQETDIEKKYRPKHD